MDQVPFLTRLHISMQRLSRWEFWPWRVVYVPVAIYWFFSAIRARAWVFFSAANPCMRFGGLVAYSKTEVTKILPEEYIPKTIFLLPEMQSSTILERLTQRGMTLPLVIKPDMGERGKGVRILRTEAQLQTALSKLNGAMLLQSYEDLPMELGVMYSRHPSEQRGRITSIVRKEFPVLIGDGKSTVLQLLLANIRTRLSYKIHLIRHSDKLHTIPSKDEEIRMVYIGNHMLGTTFYDGNDLISPELELVFDKLAKQMPGFYIGRFDLRTESVQELLKGNFKIIEVNGVNSEPCHIYDPSTPLWKGLRDLMRHWKRIYAISIANHKNGVPYASFAEIRAEIRRHNREVYVPD